MIRDHKATAARSRSSCSVLARAILATACVSLLAGCYTSARKDIAARAPVDYRQRFPIVVKEKARTVQLFIGDSRGSLTPDQRADVLTFAQEWKREATGGVVIQVPVGARNSAAAGGAVNEARAMLVALGIPPNGVVVRGYRPKNPTRLATVRMSYPRMAAEAGPCGFWPNDIGPTTESFRENKPYWNFGCASQRNLAAMVDNPTDLVQPRGDGAVYQGRRTVVMDNYRKGDQTSSKAPPNDSAKISDIGK